MKMSILAGIIFVFGWSAGALTLDSKDLKNNGTMSDDFVFNGFGCSGKNMTPELHWKNAPKDAKSFAITVYDPDAPTGSGWWHWTVVNIPANTKELTRGLGGPSNPLPAGAVEGRTDFGKPGYGGPCPPKGDADHRYIFTLHALKVPKLDIDAEASGAMVGFYIKQNEIESSTLVVKYGRK